MVASKYWSSRALQSHQTLPKHGNTQAPQGRESLLPAQPGAVPFWSFLPEGRVPQRCQLPVRVRPRQARGSLCSCPMLSRLVPGGQGHSLVFSHPSVRLTQLCVRTEIPAVCPRRTTHFSRVAQAPEDVFIIFM